MTEVCAEDSGRRKERICGTLVYSKEDTRLLEKAAQRIWTLNYIEIVMNVSSGAGLPKFKPSSYTFQVWQWTDDLSSALIFSSVKWAH